MKKVYLTIAILLIPTILFAAPVAVVERDDGSVAIISKVKGASYEDVLRGTDLEGKAYVIMDSSELPSRETRDAWELKGEKIKINKNKDNAKKEKKLHKGKIAKRIRENAINDLIIDGELPLNYED